jgi:hypothetical protein
MLLFKVQDELTINCFINYEDYIVPICCKVY